MRVVIDLISHLWVVSPAVLVGTFRKISYNKRKF